jgi:hypothetical protein
MGRGDAMTADFLNPIDPRAAVPTICPQLQSSPMISGDEIPLLARLFRLLAC